MKIFLFFLLCLSLVESTCIVLTSHGAESCLYQIAEKECNQCSDEYCILYNIENKHLALYSKSTTVSSSCLSKNVRHNLNNNRNLSNLEEVFTVEKLTDIFTTCHNYQNVNIASYIIITLTMAIVILLLY